MATGGVFSRSFQGASDGIFDFICTLCENHNKTVEASNYCTVCDQFYCQVCLEFHRNIPALKTHTVLGRNKIKRWGKQKRSVSMPTEICSQHSGETVEMFCGNHELLCCHACVSLKHGTCDDMQFIPEVAQRIAQSQEFLTVNKNIERMVSDMEQIKNTRQQKKATLGKSRKDVLQSIKDYRKHVNKVFDTLEKKVTDDMEKLYKDSDTAIQDDINRCDHFMAELKHGKQQLETTSVASESQTFIYVKKLQQQMKDGDQLMQTVISSPRNDSLEFIIDPVLEEYFASLNNLGKLEMSSTVPYRASNGRDYNVKIKDDKNNCFITGSCQMADGTILLTDSNNSKLKRLDTAYKVTDHCDLPAKPMSVCCIDRHEAALSDISDNIRLVSVGSKMTVTRSIKMKHRLYGLAYNNNQLYVCDTASKVYIYNMSGTCLRTLYKDNNGLKMFSYTQQLAISPDGDKIYVADAYKGLVTLDGLGQLLSTFSDKQLSNAGGVCLGNDSSVFVCGYMSHNVIQVGEGGKQMIRVVATQTDRIKNPRSICIDLPKSTLMVTMGGDTMRVFNLK